MEAHLVLGAVKSAPWLRVVRQVEITFANVRKIGIEGLRRGGFRRAQTADHPPRSQTASEWAIGLSGTATRPRSPVTFG
jgi:hypothetical protein